MVLMPAVFKTIGVAGVGWPVWGAGSGGEVLAQRKASASALIVDSDDELEGLGGLSVDQYDVVAPTENDAPAESSTCKRVRVDFDAHSTMPLFHVAALAVEDA